MKYLVITGLFLLTFLFACGGTNQQYSESKMLEIYSVLELEPPAKAQKVIQKYKLDNSHNREAYYEQLRELSTNQDKWEDFLKKVDDYKKQKARK